MRVIGGELRGRRLHVVDVPATRPTTDKVRQAVFNALGSLDVLDGAIVADLYAGTGAMGIEALSRGAEHCTFVERDRAALRTLRANLDALGLAGRATVLAGDAAAAASRLDVDLAFVDPPYGFDAWPELLAGLAAPFTVLEAGRPVELPADWELVREKAYGRTWVGFARRTDG